MTTAKRRVLATLTECSIELPDDGVTLEKIRHRGTHFRIDEGEFLAFRLERHPTMYLSDSQLGGRYRSPARFHVVTDYRLDLDDETWCVTEHEATFDFDPQLVIEAELDALGRKHAIEEQIETVKTADDPEDAFDNAFDSWIDHWDDKFAEVRGRPVPDDQREEIIRLLVNELRSRAGLG
ncbi:hypothetical protein SAMN06266787_10974 [Halorubrum ezzemoulense]|uniref:DUF402 domain-containing protein n=1 Tax=Halorubrum ezzemoulense TaxID=337243 RepID=A0A238Y967_HALEZ|nr:hypothetical protein [Halorubrum ezzemoulense]SNR67368.1 hypothetical protein SAMN06266787_10974 [Halorubrum ezzemoulense]